MARDGASIFNVSTFLFNSFIASLNFTTSRDQSFRESPVQSAAWDNSKLEDNFWYVVLQQFND